MTENESIQQYLWDNGYFQKVGVTDRSKAVDGKFGRNSQAALALAQADWKKEGKYNKKIDGLIGDGTRAALAAVRAEKARPSTTSTPAAAQPDSILGRFFRRTSPQPADADSTETPATSRSDSSGIGTWLVGKAASYIAGRSDASDETKNLVTEALTGTPKHDTARIPTASAYKSEWATNGFSDEDLGNLVLRYTFNKYHGIGNDTDQWGISYNYSPGSTSHLFGRALSATGKVNPTITLNIDSKIHSQEAAEKIARGAGMRTYRYNGRTHQTNLFAGGDYKDRADFEKQIAALERAGKAADAQKLYNTEMKRQFDTYGIDDTMLKDKSTTHWNLLYGVIPTGYSGSAVGAIAAGYQAYQDPDEKANVSGLGTDYYGYRYDPNNPETRKGRLIYDDFDSWYKGRIAGTGKYNHVGISPTRGTTSTYFWGIPVAADARGSVLSLYEGTRADSPTQIDRRTYYNINTEGRGTSQMQPWLYREISKNPTAAFAYLSHLFGERSTTEEKDEKGRPFYAITTDKTYAFDQRKADALARAAGMTAYHRGMSSKQTGGDSVKWIGEDILGAGNHDLYESLKTFYENGFDAEGKLRSNFRYSENGYNHRYDGGSYTVFVSGGKPTRAEDNWDADMPGMPKHMKAAFNSGYRGDGMTSQVHYTKFGGRLLRFCQAGGGLQGGNKHGDVIDIDQCAEWMNNLLRDNGYEISGNAWNLNDTTTVFNGFENLEKPAAFDTKAVAAYNREASKNVLKNFDSKTLDTSKPYIVNMYYTDSPAQKQAYDSGENVTGTHAGVLTFEDGKWVVTHNIHGKIYQDDFLKLQGGKGKYGVTAIYSPRKSTLTDGIKRSARKAYTFSRGLLDFITSKGTDSNKA